MSRPLALAALALFGCDEAEFDSNAAPDIPWSPPQVTLVAPSPGTLFEPGERVDFVFEVSDHTEDTFDLAYTWTLEGLDGQPSWNDLVLREYDGEVRAIWPDAEEGYWSLSLVAKDARHERGEASVTIGVGYALEPGLDYPEGMGSTEIPGL